MKPRALFIPRFRTCVVKQFATKSQTLSVKNAAMISPIVGRGIVVGIDDEQNRMGNSNNKGFLILKRDVVLGEELRWKEGCVGYSSRQVKLFICNEQTASHSSSIRRSSSGNEQQQQQRQSAAAAAEGEGGKQGEGGLHEEFQGEGGGCMGSLCFVILLFYVVDGTCSRARGLRRCRCRGKRRGRMMGHRTGR